MKKQLYFISTFLLVMLLIVVGCDSSIKPEPNHTSVSSQTSHTKAAPSSPASSVCVSLKTTSSSSPAPSAQKSASPTNTYSSAVSLPNWANIDSYVCYYGDYNKKLKNFDVAIIESDNMSASEIATLNNAGVYTIAYLTIGEDDELHAGNKKGPGGMASYYFNDAGRPAKNKNWNSYYVNAGDPEWQKIILNKARAIFKKGCKGLFLDTVDTIDLYPKSKNGMKSLIALLRQEFPDCKLVMNRGFGLIREVAPYINGIMFENLCSDYDFNKKTYRKLSSSELAENVEMLTKTLIPIRNKNPFHIFTLDYCDAKNTKQITEYTNYSLSFGCIPYCASINLDKIFDFYSKK